MTPVCGGRAPFLAVRRAREIASNWVLLAAERRGALGVGFHQEAGGSGVQRLQIVPEAGKLVPRRTVVLCVVAWPLWQHPGPRENVLPLRSCTEKQLEA